MVLGMMAVVTSIKKHMPFYSCCHFNLYQNLQIYYFAVCQFTKYQAPNTKLLTQKKIIMKMLSAEKINPIINKYK